MDLCWQSSLCFLICCLGWSFCIEVIRVASQLHGPTRVCFLPKFGKFSLVTSLNRLSTPFCLFSSGTPISIMLLFLEETDGCHKLSSFWKLLFLIPLVLVSFLGFYHELINAFFHVVCSISNALYCRLHLTYLVLQLCDILFLSFNLFDEILLLLINFIPELTDLPLWVFLQITEFLHDSYFAFSISI